MIVIICVKYKKNWSRTVEATKRTRFSKSRPNDLEDISSRSKVITCDTPSHAIDHLYQIWKESILNCRRQWQRRKLTKNNKSKEDKVKVTNLTNSPKLQNFWILKRASHATHLLKLLDKMCKYEMDPMSIVEDTERTRFCPQTDRRTDGQGDTSIPPFQLRWSGGYNYMQHTLSY